MVKHPTILVLDAIQIVCNALVLNILNALCATQQTVFIMINKAILAI